MGRIVVHTHRKVSERAYGALIDMYLERLSSRGVTLKQHSGKPSPEKYMAKLKDDSEGAKLILLDIGGESGPTELFVKKWKEWRISDVNVHLAVGHEDGYSEEDISANQTLSLAPMDLPYEMATVVLLEQLYRASEIVRGSSYHRE